jgi:omega-amidase
MLPVKDLSVTIIQSEPYWLKAMDNLVQIDGLISDITEKTDLILLPEMFNTGFVTDPDLIMDTIPDITIRRMRKWADEKNCIVSGSLIVKEHGQNMNRLIWMKPGGEYEYYDKRHLFRFENEHSGFHSGNKELIAELNGWKIKPLICYDLRFPVWCKNRYSDGAYKYDIILFLSNWPASRSHTWKSLLLARAIENQCYSIGVNRSGTDGNSIRHDGESMIIDQRGEHMAILEKGRPEVKSTILSYKHLDNDRKRFTVGLDWDKFNIEYQ